MAVQMLVGNEMSMIPYDLSDHSYACGMICGVAADLRTCPLHPDAFWGFDGCDQCWKDYCEMEDLVDGVWYPGYTPFGEFNDGC
ncbi:MAG: hypothetical protein MPK62_00640 [Alphaproteobacteria bacterium]|nr:hypothetical protein [Alphaproteobacteria bacterium]MDA8029645.1 hypothetical protein [Alphaproteobacteria bacterium]